MPHHVVSGLVHDDQIRPPDQGGCQRHTLPLPPTQIVHLRSTHNEERVCVCVCVCANACVHACACFSTSNIVGLKIRKVSFPASLTILC